MMFDTYFDNTVVCSRFVKLLSQFEGNLSVLESTQRLHHHFASFLTYDNGGFGDIAHLPCSKTNTCVEYKIIIT